MLILLLKKYMKQGTETSVEEGSEDVENTRGLGFNAEMERMRLDLQAKINEIEKKDALVNVNFERKM